MLPKNFILGGVAAATLSSCIDQKIEAELDEIIDEQIVPTCLEDLPDDQVALEISRQVLSQIISVNDDPTKRCRDIEGEIITLGLYFVDNASQVDIDRQVISLDDGTRMQFNRIDAEGYKEVVIEIFAGRRQFYTAFSVPCNASASTFE